MAIFALSLGITLTWCLFFKIVLRKSISWQEAGVQIGVGLAVAMVCIMFTIPLPKYDSQVLNGHVTDKVKEKVSCSHSYQCNPKKVCSTVNGEKSCRTEWETCYEHSNDWDWDLKTTLGTVTIDRIDRRGSNEPPRWTQVRVNEPVSMTGSYVNHIRKVPESLFNEQSSTSLLEEYQDKIPQYPIRIYDYYRIDRTTLVGDIPLDVRSWNDRLSKLLATAGPEKQLNIVPVFSTEPDSRHADAISAAWLGGKKNDVITIVGVPEWPKVSWVKVVSWTDEELFKVNLRNDLLDMKEVDIDEYFSAVERNIPDFVRKPMKDFQYLVDELPIPSWVVVVTLLLTLLLNIGLTFVFHKNDL